MSEDVGKKTRNIELKIGLMVISITTVILIIYGVCQYAELEKDQTGALNRISEMASDRLAQNLAGPMWDMDEAKIERAVLSEMTEKTIYGVTVSENYEGRVLLSRQRDDNWDIINRSEAVPADCIRKKKDIIKAEEKIGSIEIFVSRSFMRKQLAREAWKNAVTILILDGCILMFLIFSLRHFLFRPVRKAVEQMSEIAAQVAAAADQVSMSSQSLAGGSSEQAASVEQASSSLEEVSAMVRQNADHANAANTLVRNTRESIRQAVEAMNRLNRSIESISSSSGETSKIVKTIDEIAFQTNLLALNAAVESARAGQAGAGFAVVADEVRNLAMRAAAAAKNTGELIENTLQRVGEGTTLVQDTARAFDLVNENSGKATELVEEIAAASIEQSQGIEHVNRAVSGINMITQQNTADAEQSASASEQLNAQAEHMRHIVREVLELIGVRMDR